jgi:pimeloyl-ACP methyl ester carboxylesterase
MNCVVNGLLCTYKTSGKGSKTVVLLHGWADSLATFTELQKELGKKYKVVSLDLPGFGGTDTPAEVWGLGDYAEFVVAFLDKIGQTKPYALIGHSNGGPIAICALASGQLTAKKLVLLASAGVRDVRTARKKVLKAVAKTGKLLSKPLPQSVRTRMRRRLYKAAGSDMLVAEHLQETFKKVVGQDIQEDAAGLQLPTLLIYGQNDTETPPAYGRLLNSRIVGSDLKIVTQAGHYVHHDQPTIVARAIQEFLGE